MNSLTVVVRKPRSILRGLNAAAVGLIYTAVWQLFLGEDRLLTCPDVFNINVLHTSF